MKKQFLIIYFVMILVVLIYPQHTYAQAVAEKNTEEEIQINSNFLDEKIGTGTGTRLAIAGATILGIGTLIELFNLSFIMALNSNDVSATIEASSDYGIFNVMHITAATFITTGSVSLLSSIGYTDDTITSKARWRRTQTILGAVLFSLGTALSITGGGLYGSELAKENGLAIGEKNEIARITGMTTLGVGIPLTTAGISSLIIAFTAE